MPVALPAAIIGSAAIGGIASSNAASKAADAQRAAAQQATDAQMAMFNRTQANLAPFIGAGQDAVPSWLAAIQGLQGALPGLTKPFAPTMDQLAQTPGYQFTLDQGLKATQNSFAAQGLGSSGAAMKGAANYAEGLAGTTFQQQYQNYLGQNAQIYNMLTGGAQLAGAPVALGANAAAQQGQIGMQTGGQIGQNIIGAGNASAAANIAQGNAIGGIAGSVPSALMAYNNPYLNGAFATNTAQPAGFASGSYLPPTNPFGAPMPYDLTAGTGATF